MASLNDRRVRYHRCLLRSAFDPYLHAHGSSDFSESVLGTSQSTESAVTILGIARRVEVVSSNFSLNRPAGRASGPLLAVAPAAGYFQRYAGF